MTSWSPATAAAYIAAHGLETAFYSRYPNAYGANHAADWMAIWLNSQIPPPDGPDDPNDKLDIRAASDEDKMLTDQPGYKVPFTPVPNSQPTNFPPADAPPTVHQTIAPVPTAGQKSSSGKLPLLIGLGLLAWLISSAD